MTGTPQGAVLERMDLTTLKLDPELDTAGDEVRLATQAKELLGYDRLYDEVVGPEEKPTTLLATLQALNIAPFTEASVEKYKQEAAKKMGVASRWPARIRNIMFVITSIGFLMMLVGVVSWMLGASIRWLAGTGAGAVVMIFGAICLSTSNNFIAGTRIRWQMCMFKGYPKKMPAEIVHRAVSIKEACEDAYFSVDELTMSRVPMGLFDPFLVARLGREQYYIDVWNEPDFKARPLA